MIRTASTPQPSLPSKRSLRCLRCTERKFRTPRDLALHILSKHGEIQLPSPSEDSRSVTLNSPFEKGDLKELDQLVANASDKSVTDGASERRRIEHNSISTRPVLGERNTISSSGVPGKRKRSTARLIQKQRHRTKRRAYYSETSDDNERNFEENGGLNKRYTERREPEPVEGESTGPRASEVFLARCRAGHIPLVPIQLQPSVTLNFIDELF